MFRRSQTPGRTAEQLLLMRRAGLLVGETLEMLRGEVRAGVTTLALDALAEDYIRSHGGIPNFQLVPGYTHTLCTSVNEQIVHGIPAKTQVLADGDIISVDCGAILDGWHGDSAVTVPVGEISDEDRALSKACESAMWAGIEAVRPGGRLTDISYAIQEACRAAALADRADYGIVAEYGGHGIGTSMHMDPFLPNHGEPGKGPKLVPGMALAIEPMLTAGDPETRELEDGWTVVTESGKRAVHWEHTVAVTEDGYSVLTLPG